MGAWFMWLQVVVCAIGAAGFACQRQWAMGWCYFCYSLAALGFVAMAGGFK